MAALLAAEDGARDLHPLEDVLVTDGCPDDLAAGRLDHALETAVREDRDDQPAARQVVAAQAVEGQDPEHLVAIDDASVRVDRDQPVGVAVEGEAGIGTGRDDRRGQRCRCGRSGVDVDVDAVRVGMDHVDPGAGRLQDGAPDRRPRSVRRVEHQVEAPGVDR